MTTLDAVLAHADAELDYASNKCVHEVAGRSQSVKTARDAVGCSIPYMSFNLTAVYLIPELRISDKGVIKDPEMALGPRYDL